MARAGRDHAARTLAKVLLKLLLKPNKEIRMDTGNRWSRLKWNAFLLGPPARGRKTSNGAVTRLELLAVCAALLPKSHSRVRECGFTRVELLAVITALFLIALVLAPAAVSMRSDSERAICFNNLRLVGRAVQMWAGDHNQQTPWRTLVSDGGTMSPKRGAAWYEFSFLSNQLASPKVLVCPSDVGAIRARDFDQFRETGFRQDALSYIISLDATPDAPRGWLSGDRNLRPKSYGATSCSAGVNDAGSLAIEQPNPVPAWTNGAVHGEFGHVLLLDGSVEFTSTARLRELLFLSPGDFQNSAHFLKAR
jgi:hypothetical protein